jgi:hypothetical protein
MKKRNTLSASEFRYKKNLLALMLVTEQIFVLPCFI